MIKQCAFEEDTYKKSFLRQWPYGLAVDLFRNDLPSDRSSLLFPKVIPWLRNIPHTSVIPQRITRLGWSNPSTLYPTEAAFNQVAKSKLLVQLVRPHTQPCGLTRPCISVGRDWLKALENLQTD